MVEKVAGTRSGGRSTLVVAAVRSAVETLVAELGAENVTIALIAEHAGVNATSIYRRWGDLPTLINEVAAYRLDPERPLPDTGDLQADVRAWAHELATHFGTPANASLLRAGAALANSGPSDCTVNRRNEAGAFVARYRSRAQEDGVGATPTADQIINYIVAPITYRAIFAPRPLQDDEVDALVDDLFRVNAA
ncbi:MAG TPA: TetR/AcrR family transcriptional regulator C-terminal ligand-binding domain-containing protein [Microbacteriaceae bacterium]|jgi:AcrR family transcriptional regulator|nr:TetR/AcrR family transcriptional regulator C-terminal ligand-binding domain-containing protein [Microbacteriaceae bacterium]